MYLAQDKRVNLKNFILITGVSSGIGHECAKFMLGKGYHVFGSIRTDKDATRLREELGEAFHPLIFDLTDHKAVCDAAEEAKGILRDGRLVAIVNNAGIAVTGPLLHIDMTEVAHQLDVNVLGTLKVIQAFFPLFRPGTEPGVRKRIIQVGSVSGLIASPFLGPYAMSKFALEAMTDSLRRECMLYPDIDVVILEPASIETPIWDKTLSAEQTYEDTDYGWIFRQKDAYIRKQREHFLSPQILVEAIYRMVTIGSVPTRKVIARQKWLYTVFRKWLPDRYADKLITRAFNFEK